MQTTCGSCRGPRHYRSSAGSGVRSDNLEAIFEYADAAIVGSSLKEGEVWHGAMSKEAVFELVMARDRILPAGGTS